MSAVSPPLGYTGGRTLGSGGLVWMNAGWIVVVAATLLTVGGSFSIAITEPALAKKQLMFAGLGIIAAAVACVPSHKLLSKSAWYLYGISAILLLLVLVLLVLVLLLVLS